MEQAALRAAWLKILGGERLAGSSVARNGALDGRA